jgi:1,4-alpha-glucan branching enzyme
VSLDWALLGFQAHAGVRLLVGDLNRLYRSEPALQHNEHNSTSFEWLELQDAERNVICFLRKGGSADEAIVVACNFSSVPRDNYRIGVPRKGVWREIFNSDSKVYGGSGRGNWGEVRTTPFPLAGRNHSMTVDIPPLGAVFLRWESEAL